MRINLLGVLVDETTYNEAIEQVKSWWGSSGRYYLVTPNPEMIIKAQQDPLFRKILNESSLSIPDGAGLLWAGRALGTPFRARVTGVDLAEELLQQASKEGKSVFFLGGRDGVGQVAAEKFLKKFPNLQIAGIAEGSPNESQDRETRSLLGTKHIDLLLVAYGHGKQEKWIWRNLPQTDVSVAIGIGGAFDYWSGRISRAPKLLRNLGLEWLYRLISEPWRWRRQLALPQFAWLILKQKFL